MASQANHDSHLQLNLDASGGSSPSLSWEPPRSSSPNLPSMANVRSEPAAGGPPMRDMPPVLDILSDAPLPEGLLGSETGTPGGQPDRPAPFPAAARPRAAGSSSALSSSLPAATFSGAARSGAEAVSDEVGAGEVGAGEVGAGEVGAGEVWLNGDVLMCGCPDCHAPMTIRLWLMVADCWQCGASIELTEEQEREARRLLRERDRREPAAAAAPPSQAVRDAPASEARPSRESAPRETPRPAEPEARRPARSPESPGSQPAPRRQDPAPTAPASQPTRQPTRQPSAPDGEPAGSRSRRAPADAARRRMQQINTRRGVHVWVNEMFRMTPAWLVSLVFHLVLLTVLGMLSFADEDDRYITLSATVDRELHREGGQKIEALPEDEVDFDLPIPDEVDLQQQEVREAMVKADQDARQLQLDPDAPEPDLPSLQQVKQQIKTASRSRQSLAARDPRLRVEMVQREGGTTLTEAAVARGLRWLAQQQNASGSWSLHTNQGAVRNDAAATSLALLPFLGAGQSHLVGRYQDTVSRGLRWLVDQQADDGDLRGSRDNSGMYAHGQAAIVLCEAYLLSGDEELRVPAQKAVDFIVEAQHPAGGWRYQPGQAGDTSVLGWQVMALQSARTANLTVPPETFQLAGHYLDTAQSDEGAQYSYMPRNRPTEVMTAEGLLCRMYMGWNKDNPALGQGINFLVDRHLPSRGQPNYYYWYYGTQAMHHWGGPQWERWNLHMRDILVNTQETRGRNAGSWPVAGPHASAGGRVYVTSLSVCTLEVYYRHLPIFRQLDLD